MTITGLARSLRQQTTDAAGQATRRVGSVTERLGTPGVLAAIAVVASGITLMQTLREKRKAENDNDW